MSIEPCNKRDGRFLKMFSLSSVLVTRRKTFEWAHILLLFCVGAVIKSGVTGRIKWIILLLYSQSITLHNTHLMFLAKNIIIAQNINWLKVNISLCKVKRCHSVIQNVFKWDNIFKNGKAVYFSCCYFVWGSVSVIYWTLCVTEKVACGTTASKNKFGWYKVSQPTLISNH